jgi:DNA mismatch repair protein MSH2
MLFCRPGSGKSNWKLAKQASPGNLQDVEEELGSVGALSMDSARRAG